MWPVLKVTFVTEPSKKYAKLEPSPTNSKEPPSVASALLAHIRQERPLQQSVLTAHLELSVMSFKLASASCARLELSRMKKERLLVKFAQPATTVRKTELPKRSSVLLDKFLPRERPSVTNAEPELTKTNLDKLCAKSAL